MALVMATADGAHQVRRGVGGKGGLEREEGGREEREREEKEKEREGRSGRR
jgi:hypothetical protein